MPSGKVTPGLSAASLLARSPCRNCSRLISTNRATGRTTAGPPAGAMLSEGLAGRVSPSGPRSQPWRTICAPRRRGQPRAAHSPPPRRGAGPPPPAFLVGQSTVSRSLRICGVGSKGAQRRREPRLGRTDRSRAWTPGEWGGGGEEEWRAGAERRSWRGRRWRDAVKEVQGGTRSPRSRAARGPRGPRAAGGSSARTRRPRSPRAPPSPWRRGARPRPLPARRKAGPCTKRARARRSLYSRPEACCTGRGSLPLRPSLPCSPHKQKGCA